MTITVVDASVALKWFVPGEKLREEALDVLSEIQADPSAFMVPELFFNEMVAVLCRTTGATTDQLAEYVSDLEELGLARIGNGHELLRTALTLARDWKISGYDAVYAATAQLCSGEWLTADSKAARRIKERHLVCTLAEWRPGEG